MMPPNNNATPPGYAGIVAALRQLADALESHAAVDRSTSPQDAFYSSQALPPDCPSRERFRRLAGSVAREHGSAAAWRVAQVWFVTRDAWAAHRGARPSASSSAATTPNTAPTPPDTDLLSVDAVLRATGLRVVSPKFGPNGQETPANTPKPRVNQTRLGSPQ